MKTNFISITKTARSIGVPVAWMKAEAEEGRIPHLKVGRRLLFNLKEVEQSLLERASTSSQSDSKLSNNECDNV